MKGKEPETTPIGPPQSGAQNNGSGRIKQKPQRRPYRTGAVTIVVPVKNEEAAIGPTLRSIPVDTLNVMGFDVETLILDGQSRDSTRDLAYQHGGATVLFDEGRGKGQALQYARRFLKSDYVIMMDGDGTYAADAIPRMVTPLAWDEADVVMGRRHIRPGAMSLTHRIGNRCLSTAAVILYQQKCPDLCTGMWGFKSTALQALPLRSRGFDLEADLYAAACRMDLRIRHVPLDYLPRKGASKLTKADGFAILWRLVQKRLASVKSSRPRVQVT